MKRTFAGLTGLMCLGCLAVAAQAAPLGSAAATAPAARPSNVIEAHGIHWSCKRDRYGWHRSHVWGRERCVPRRYKPWYKFW
jgi:hypothetical protein